jgi:hypothetical protein
MKPLLLLTLSLLLLTSAAQAARPALPQGLTVAVEPIFGFEHVQKISPTFHFKNRLTYGARFTAGYLVLSGEGEYTRATDSESYPAEDASLKDTDDTLRLGVRTGYPVAQALIASLRAGGQARRGSHEQTTGGVTTVTAPAIEYHPYAGLEVRAAISSVFSLSAGVLVAFNDIHDMSKNEYQTTAGFQIRVK